MATQEFDKQFQQLCTAMIEIAYEYVDYNKEEVDAIYVYGSMEANTLFYDVFYKINGEYVFTNEVNKFSKKQYDVSERRVRQLLNIGSDYLDTMEKLFTADEREVPTQIKMIYIPKTEAFDCQISYDLQWSKHFQCSNGDVFDNWLEELKEQNTNQ